MDGWMDDWIDRWIDRWMDGDQWIDAWMDGYISCDDNHLFDDNSTTYQNTSVYDNHNYYLCVYIQEKIFQSSWRCLKKLLRLMMSLAMSC